MRANQLRLAHDSLKTRPQDSLKTRSRRIENASQARRKRVSSDSQAGLKRVSSGSQASLKRVSSESSRCAGRFRVNESCNLINDTRCRGVRPGDQRLHTR